MEALQIIRFEFNTNVNLVLSKNDDYFPRAHQKLQISDMLKRCPLCDYHSTFQSVRHFP